MYRLRLALYDSRVRSFPVCLSVFPSLSWVLIKLEDLQNQVLYYRKNSFIQLRRSAGWFRPAAEHQWTSPGRPAFSRLPSSVSTVTKLYNESYSRIINMTNMKISDLKTDNTVLEFRMLCQSHNAWLSMCRLILIKALNEHDKAHGYLFFVILVRGRSDLWTVYWQMCPR